MNKTGLSAWCDQDHSGVPIFRWMRT